MNKTHFVASFIFLLTSCNKDVPANGSVALNGISFLTDSQNMYEWTVNADSAGIPNYFEKDTLTVSVLSNTELIYGYSNLTLLEIKSLKYSWGNAKIWYANSKDSLIEVAYSGAGSVPIIMPKTGKMVNTYPDFSMPFTLKKYAAIKTQRSDTILKREDNRIVYRFPLTVNNSWISFTYPFLEKREVVGTEFVTVKAGHFFCTKIKTEIYFGGQKDTGIIWFDYVAAEGLILRTLSFKGFLSTEQSPDTRIPMSSFERSELISRK